MKISVIIPTFKRPGYLRNCLNGLLSQTRQADEILVVFRESDSETKKCLSDFPPFESRRIKPVHVSRPGLLSSLKAGIQRAGGDILCFTDDDAVPRRDWLERLERVYADPSISGAGGRVINRGVPVDNGIKPKMRQGSLTWYGRYYGHFYLEPAEQKPFDVYFLQGVNMSYRKEVFSGFDIDLRIEKGDGYCNEVDLGLSMKKRGMRILYDPMIRVDHFLAPRMLTADRKKTSASLFSVGHNYAYVMLKHLSPSRKVVFLLFFFLIGMRAPWGLGTIVRELVLRRRIVPVSEIIASFQGGLAGIVSYLRYKRYGPEK